MTKHEKAPNRSETSDENPEVDLAQKIAVAENRLAVLAQVVGADFGLAVTFGELGGGSFFSPEKNSITLDPQILVEGRDFVAGFIAGHEGGHRAVTRSLEQIGMSKTKALELYKKTGFGYLSNCLEDCADNNWVGTAFEKFQQNSDQFYAEQFAVENAEMITPEIARMISQLGYTPKFVSFGSEVIRRWATGEFSQKLDSAVVEALDKTKDSAEACEQEIPGVYAKEGERLKKAKDRFKILYEQIWSEFEKLVESDVNLEKLRELANQMNQESQVEGGKSGAGSAGELSEEMKKELAEKIEENLKDQLAKLEQAIDELNQQVGEADSVDAKQKLEAELEKLIGERQELESGGENVVPWDELSDELKKKIEEIFAKLPKATKKELESLAQETLMELDDQLIKETRGQLSVDQNPPTHQEVAEAEKEAKGQLAQKDKEAKDREREKKADQKLTTKMTKEIEGELSEYDRIYKEIAPLADQLYERIVKVFLPQRHPRWDRGHPTGHRLDLGKVMQFQADRSLYDKIWERKSVPKKIDYRFTMLVDLSGSMRGEKINQTFRGTILMAEVLNRLGIDCQILGFQDELILYKDFNQKLTGSVRQQMVTMPKEVVNEGQHNQAEWNSDGYCLGQASELLEQHKGKDNFLVVLSDGDPAPDEAHNGAEYDLKKVVEGIRKKTKQRLIGIGLGPETDHVGDYYPTALPNLTMADLPELLSELLEDMIKTPGKYQ